MPWDVQGRHQHQMCDVVPGSDARASDRRAGDGKDLPPIGNARPQRAHGRARSSAASQVSAAEIRA